jgi:hypothetical protein
MGLKTKIQKSWDKVNGEGSEFLIPILIITMLWILITHTI